MQRLIFLAVINLSCGLLQFAGNIGGSAVRPKRQMMGPKKLEYPRELFAQICQDLKISHAFFIIDEITFRGK